MSGDDFTNQIKNYYLGPALECLETYWEDKEAFKRSGLSGMAFKITTKIWRCEHLPVYRVAIPASEQYNGNFDNDMYANPDTPIEMRFITYVPTGNVVYDTRLPIKIAIVYEYILESMLGKKDF